MTDRPHIFLSYAKEDKDRIARFASRLRRFEVYDWAEGGDGAGASIVGGVEQAIASADAFFAFLSPHYLASSWCRRERNIAVHIELARERQTGHRFIHLLTVEDVRFEDLGLLQDTRAVDLTLQNAEEEFERVLNSIESAPGVDGASTTAATTTETIVEAVSVKFRNREDELRDIRDDLNNSGGSHFWLVVAPPHMGKSWFLDQLVRSLGHEWVSRIVDMAAEPIDLRLDPDLLLDHLLGSSSATQWDEDALSELAIRILEANKPHLFVLDGGELLDRALAHASERAWASCMNS